ncbi:hypothetical protein Baya_13319 [Bagarius yarrelli]|uniref:Uncharacterized protein n=1 Tax=Bagarius yarrelli TaxID=175774 RepID=A0A556V5Z7_BAGYA|nr:hypothetical protein Baya_13319 [Bagarius yarrelli]
MMRFGKRGLNIAATAAVTAASKYGPHPYQQTVNHRSVPGQTVTNQTAGRSSLMRTLLIKCRNERRA